jgi:signal transduction histidine kinase/ActR/RegA family two-component response regulator
VRDESKLPPDAPALRRRAEARVRATATRPPAPPTAADTERLLHELQVHQVELELQNEELRQAREAGEAALARYTALYDGAPVAYLTLDRAGGIRGLNVTGATLLGEARAAVVGTPFQRFLPADTHPVVEAVLKAAGPDPDPQAACEVPLRPTAGPLRFVRLQATAEAAGDECRVVLIDLTDRRQLEEARLLRTKLEATGVLAAGIAHDFNNLLMAILVNLELLREPTDDATACLAAATQAVLEARGLTQQFLTFAKGGLPVRRVLALAGVVRDAATLVLRGAPVECDLTLPTDLWLVDGDPTQLGQVIRNLVLNAREAMPKGGRVTIRAENVGEPTAGVRVTIADHGPGIPADLLPKVFDPYFSTKQRGAQRGTGLGLTVCRAIVEQHGGTLTVDSTVGVGTTAQIVLPAAVAPAHAALRPAPLAPPGTGRLLVMDDEPLVRTTLGALLQRLGYTVELAERGEEAVALYQVAQAQGDGFAAVILDLTVRGGMGGVATLEALRRLDPAVTALAVSGYADDPVIVDPVRHGFKGALAKPHGIAALRDLLAQALGR